MDSFQSDEMEFFFDPSQFDLLEPADFDPFGISSMAKVTLEGQIQINQPETVHGLYKGNDEAGGQTVTGNRDSASEMDRPTAPISAEQERSLRSWPPASPSAPASSVPNKTEEATANAKASSTYRAPELPLWPAANPLIRPLCPGSSLGNTAPYPEFQLWSPNAFSTSVSGDGAQFYQAWSPIGLTIPTQNLRQTASVHTVTRVDSPTRMQIAIQAPASPRMQIPVQAPASPRMTNPIQYSASPRMQIRIQSPASPRMQTPIQASASPRMQIRIQAPASPRMQIPIQAPASPQFPIPIQSPASPRFPNPIQAPASPRIKIAIEAPVSPGSLIPLQPPALRRIEIIPVQAPASLALTSTPHALGSSSKITACEPHHTPAGTRPYQSCPQPLAPLKQVSWPVKRRNSTPVPPRRPSPPCFCRIIDEKELVSEGKQLYFKQIRTLKYWWQEGTTREQIMAALDRLWNNLSGERKREFCSEAVEKISKDLQLMDPTRLSPTQHKQLKYLRSHGKPNCLNFDATGRSKSGCFCRSVPAPRVNPDLAIMMGFPLPGAHSSRTQSSRAVSSPVIAVNTSQRNAPLVQQTVRHFVPETILKSHMDSGTRRTNTGQRKRKLDGPQISKAGLEEAPKRPKASKPRKKVLKKEAPIAYTKTARSSPSQIQPVKASPSITSSVGGIQPVQLQVYNIVWDSLEKVFKVFPASVLDPSDCPNVTTEGSPGIEKECSGVAEDPTAMDMELSTLFSTDAGSGEVDDEATFSWLLGLNASE